MGIAEREKNPWDGPVQPSEAARKIVAFRVAGQAYGLPLSAVCEILPLPHLSQPPGLPSVLAGFLNLGGVAVPVVSLARLFGLVEHRPSLYTPLLLVRWAQVRLALLVDAVEGIVMVRGDMLVPLGENLCFNDCAEGLATLGNTNVVLLSLERLLHEQELHRLGQLAGIEQSRLAQLQEVRQ